MLTILNDVSLRVSRRTRRRQPRFEIPGSEIEHLEDRVLLTHCGPVDQLDGIGPRFIGDGLVTIVEDFSDNPNHEDPANVSAGFDACETQIVTFQGNTVERLFTHTTVGSTAIRSIDEVPVSPFGGAGVVGLPRDQVKPEMGHILMTLGSDLIQFKGIHPDFHVAAVNVDVLASTFSSARAFVDVVGRDGSISLSPSQTGVWEQLIATRGTPTPGTTDSLGSIESVTLRGVNDFSYFDNVTILIDRTRPNRPPIAFDDQVTTAPNTRIAIDVVANDHDVDGDTLTIRLPNGTNSSRGGTVQLSGQSVRYTPPDGFPRPEDRTVEARTDQFVYDLIDEHGASSSATVSILVNTPPIASDGHVLIRPRGSESVSSSIPIPPDADGDGDPMLVELVDLPQRGTISSFNPSGSFTYNPDDPNEVLEDSFRYRLQDGFGGTSAPATLLIRVPNRPPTAIGQTLSFPHGAFGPASAHIGEDPDGDPLSIVLVPYDHDGDASTPDVIGPQHGQLTFHVDGTFRYQQVARDYIDWNTGRLVSGDSRMRGSDQFAFRVRDHAALSDIATVRIDVPNTAPESNIVVHSVLSPQDIFEVDRFIVPSITTQAPPVIAPVVLDGPGSSSGELRLQAHENRVSYELNVFNLRAGLTSDGNRVDTVSAHLHFGSSALGGPVIVELFNGSPPNVNYTGLLASGIISAGDLLGALEDDFDGFLMSLGEGDIYVDVHTSSFPAGELRRQILSPLLPPIPEGDFVHFAAPGVLLGDLDFEQGSAGQALYDPLTAVLVSPPNNGSLVLRPDGSFSYAPNPGFTGLDRFQYRATDGFLTSDVTQVVLAVTPEVQVATPLIPDNNPNSPTLQAIDDSYSTLASEGLVVFGGDVGIRGKKGILYDEESIRRNDFPRERRGEAFDLDFVSEPNVIIGLGMSTTTLGYDAYFFLALPTIVGGRAPFFGECFTGTRYYSYAYLLDSELGQGLSNTGMVTLRSHDTDSDGDGVFDTEEGLCEPLVSNENDNFRDPSTHDDASIATIENTVDGRRLVLNASAGTFRETTSETALGADSPPADVAFPVGFVGFEVHDLPANGQTTVSLRLPEGVLVESYWKYGREPDNPLTVLVDESAESPHWWEFAFDPSTQTGAQFDGNVVTLHFVDGERGDDDLTVNGVIVDPGGPGLTSPKPASSIHGLKFIDRNADGIQQGVDPAFPGVVVALDWTDTEGQPMRLTTTTSVSGEFQFTDLPPGVTYTVSEILRDGWLPTTPSSQPITAQPGVAYVANSIQAQTLRQANGVDLPIVIQPDLLIGNGPFLQPGDANENLVFDQLDLVLVQQGGKYRTGLPATWQEGDWNGGPGGTVGSPPQGDGVFDQGDIVAALSTALYRQGPYAVLATEADSGLNRLALNQQVGNANRDGRFDKLDLALALSGKKYRTSLEALWHEGDWNDDGFFDQLDIVFALQAGIWLVSP